MICAWGLHWLEEEVLAASVIVAFVGSHSLLATCQQDAASSAPLTAALLAIKLVGLESIGIEARRADPPRQESRCSLNIRLFEIAAHYDHCLLASGQQNPRRETRHFPFQDRLARSPKLQQY